MPSSKDIRKTLRFKPDEYARIEAKAGRKPISAYLREAALGEADRARVNQARQAGLGPSGFDP